MTPRTPLPEAQRIIARDYEPLRAKVTASVRGKLSGQGLHADPADLDAYYNQAWHALYGQLVDGRQIENPAGFLVIVAYRRAIEDLRSSGDDVYHAELDESVGREDDVPGLLDDQTRLRHLLEGMRERLTDRERLAAALCLIHGYSRPDAAEALGVSRKRIEKIMDGVQRKLTALTADIDEGWCENRRSLIAAYSLGLLEEGGERRQAATDHLRECSACRRFVATSRGLAGVFPPVGLPVVLLATGATGGAVAHSGGGTAVKPKPRVNGKALAGAAVAAAVLAAGCVAYAVTSSSDSGSGADRPPAAAPASAVASAAANASTSASSAAARASDARARTAARAERRATRRVARRAEQRAARRAAARARVASAAAAPPATAPTPAATAPPPPPAVAQPPAPAAAPKPAAKPSPVVTDAAQEFGPEQNRP